MPTMRPISEICERYRINRSNKQTAVELQVFGYQACHVFCFFSATCLRLDENDGI